MHLQRFALSARCPRRLTVLARCLQEGTQPTGGFPVRNPRKGCGRSLRTRTSRSRRGHATLLPVNPERTNHGQDKAHRRRDRPPESRPSQGRGSVREVREGQGRERKKALAQEICTELSVHATIEEEIFYPACKGKVEEDLMSEAYVEHDGAKVMIAELLGELPGRRILRRQDDGAVGRDQTSCQGRGEAGRRRLRPGARSRPRYGGARASRLAARKVQLLEQFKASGLPTPKTRAFTGHKLEQSKPVEAAA